MNDIPALIDGLTAIRNALRDDLPLFELDWDRCLTEAAEALSRLIVTPLPEEIAELTEDLLDNSTTSDCDCPQCDTARRAAAALEQMARENRALRTESEDRAGQMEQLRDRIRELEAERDAIRAKTIEDASEALLAKRDSLTADNRHRLGLEMGARIIRALASPPPATTETPGLPSLCEKANGDSMSRNRATPEGREFGKHLARFCDQAEPKARLRFPELPPRCSSCAFREGPHVANGSPQTQMDALKCWIEGHQFNCHEPAREGAVCSGWAIMMLAKDEPDFGKCPWPFSDEAKEETP